MPVSVPALALALALALVPVPVPVSVPVPVPVPVPAPPTNPHVYGKAGRLQCIGPFFFRFVSFRFSFHLGSVFLFFSFRFWFFVSFFVSFSFSFRSDDKGGAVGADGSNVWMSCRDGTSLEMGGEWDANRFRFILLTFSF